MFPTGSSQDVVFPMVDASNYDTLETGLSPACKVCINGTWSTADNSPATETSEAGWYKLTLSASELSTAGQLIVVATDGTAAAAQYRNEFVVYDEVAATLDGTAWNTGADHFWRRHMSEVAASSDGDAISSTEITGMMAVLKIAGKVTRSGAALVIYLPDGVTDQWSQTLTEAAGATNPVVEQALPVAPA